MDPPRERPWTEHEKVFLLAEIIKAAPVPSDYLLRIIRESGIQPKWFEMPLPFGRSLHSCQMVFEQLNTGRQPMQYPLSAGYPVAPQPSMQGRLPPSEIPKKRPLAPETSTPNPMGRIIQPRPPPSAFQPVDPLRPSSGYHSSAGSAASSISGGTGEPAQKKKRGRPTKAEQQARAEAAAARGEVMPPLSRASRPEPRQTQYQPEVSGRQPPHMQAPSPMGGNLASPLGYPPTPTARSTGLSETEQEPTSAGQHSRGSASGDRGSGLPAEAPSSAGAEGSPARSGPAAYERSQSASSHGQGHAGPVGPPSASAYEPRSGSLPAPTAEELHRRPQPSEQETPQRQEQQQEQTPTPQTQQQQGAQQRTTPHSFKETVGM